MAQEYPDEYVEALEKESSFFQQSVGRLTREVSRLREHRNKLWKENKKLKEPRYHPYMCPVCKEEANPTTDDIIYSGIPICECGVGFFFTDWAHVRMISRFF